MFDNLWPLLILTLLIGSSIVGAGILLWFACADALNPDRLKRDNKGRRRSDQF